MSESMTVEQARADFETWISKPPFEYSTARFGNGEYAYATVGFAWKAWQAAQAKVQARVAELEAEKWNAQIAEAALASVEQERDDLRRQNGELLAESATHVGYGNRAVRRIKAEAVREALLASAAECQLKASELSSYTASGYWITFADWLEQKANQIEGGA